MDKTTGMLHDPQQETVVAHEKLRDLVVDLLTAKGLPNEDAGTAAARMVEADLRGIHSHGSRALPLYLKDIERGFIRPEAQPQVVCETPATAVLDGDRGLGHIVSTRAMQLAVEKAREVGTGTVAVRNSNHYGAASVYILLAIEAGMIGFTTTSTAYATVAAYGSRDPGTANNAIAWGAPARQGPPFLLDMACGATSWGKVETLKLYGGSLPAGWGLDSEGRPTTDPHACKVILPAAGPRGFGLAMISSILAGPLVGGKMTLHKPWTGSPEQHPSEHFFYAIDIAAFGSSEAFYDELEATSQEIRALPPAEGFERVSLPGELEWERAAAWREQGIPLHRDHLQRLAEVAQQLGVAVPW